MLVLKSKCCIGVFVALNKLLQEIRDRVKLLLFLKLDCPSSGSEYFVISTLQHHDGLNKDLFDFLCI